MKTDAQIYLEANYNGSDLSVFRKLIRSVIKKTILLEHSLLFDESVFLFADGSKIVMTDNGIIAS